MKSIGRNDPCPCGSGKKYKRCCLARDREAEHRANVARSAVSRAMAWLEERYGVAMEIAFREEFLGGLDDEELDRLGEIPNWLLEVVELNGREFLLAEGELVLDFGRTRSLDLVLDVDGPLLDTEQRAYLETLGRRPLSLYEVVESRRDNGFLLRDLTPLDDSEDPRPECWTVGLLAPDGAMTAEGMTFAARLIPGPPWRSTGAFYPFPEAAVPGLLEELRAPSPGKERGTFLVDSWLSTLVAPPPALVDAATGDATLLVTDHYQVLDWDRLSEALAAEPDVEGGRRDGWVRVETSDAGVRRPRLGINPEDEGRVSTFARTRSLGEEGRAWLERVAGGALEWLRREIIDPADLWKNRFDPPAAGETVPIADFHPELQQDLYEHLYRDWPDRPLPALDHRTPRQALATPGGRRRVLDLLESFERGEKRQARQEGRPPVSFDFLRRQLGLGRHGR